MRVRNPRNHVVDLIFTLALFCVFAASALMVIVFGANVYQSTVSGMTANNTERTALTYLAEKVRQNDVQGSIAPGDFQGHPSLTLSQEINGVKYITYIYLYQNETLKELFAKEGAAVSYGDGQDILPAREFSMETLEDNFYRLTVVDREGKENSLLIGTRSS